MDYLKESAFATIPAHKKEDLNAQLCSIRAEGLTLIGEVYGSWHIYMENIRAKTEAEQCLADLLPGNAHLVAPETAQALIRGRYNPSHRSGKVAFYLRRDTVAALPCQFDNWQSLEQQGLRAYEI